MKGARFYLEFPDEKSKRKGTKNNGYEGHSGNCIAVFLDDNCNHPLIGGDGCYDAACAVFHRKNSPCCVSSVHPDYLSERCKRVSEEVVNNIHPELISYLKN